MKDSARLGFYSLVLSFAVFQNVTDHSGCYRFLMSLLTAELCGTGTGLGGEAGPVVARRRWIASYNRGSTCPDSPVCPYDLTITLERTSV